ncbi:unnamed protein product [Allacma fusca]|uniref:Uncharacterized protein n=1 Tax=Allacma fusca TaxID=39272 RepID=A0A8J2J5B1_9HEXA|nr:unnamed protein product [Allacma fusca]
MSLYFAAVVVLTIFEVTDRCIGPDCTRSHRHPGTLRKLFANYPKVLESATTEISSSLMVPFIMAPVVPVSEDGKLQENKAVETVEAIASVVTKTTKQVLEVDRIGSSSGWTRSPGVCPKQDVVTHRVASWSD